MRPSPCLHHHAAALPAGEQAELLPGHAEVESVLGVSLVGVENMEKSVRQILNNDTSAISTLRCLKLYLERLGCDFGDGQQLQRAAGGQGWLAARGASSVGTALWGCTQSSAGEQEAGLNVGMRDRVAQMHGLPLVLLQPGHVRDQVASCSWVTALRTGRAAAIGHFICLTG